MRGADHVDVVAFHQQDVGDHLGHRDGAPVLGTTLVTIHALELNLLTVH